MFFFILSAVSPPNKIEKRNSLKRQEQSFPYFSSAMGYDASVYVIYGVKIDPDHYFAFVLDFLDRHPDLKERAKTEADHLDLNDGEHAAEYLENYLEIEDMDGRDTLFTKSGIFICGFTHEHCVLRSQDPPKKLILPSAEKMKAFDEWCITYGLSVPELQTVVRDG
jgi:hypothetical protein